MPVLAKSANRSKRIHTKTRFSCVPCKRRHIKCDQFQPTCFACSMRGLKCHYSHSLVIKHDYVSFVRESSLNLPPYWSMTKHGLDFRFFLENSLKVLTEPDFMWDGEESKPSQLFSIYLTQFWEDVVMKAAFHERSVLELVCLYGAQERAVIEGNHTYASDVARYGQALHIVASALAQRPSDNVSVVILTWILFGHERMLSALHSSKDANLHFSAAQRFLEQAVRNDANLDTMKASRDSMLGFARAIREQCSKLSPSVAKTQNQVGTVSESFRNAEEARTWVQETLRATLSLHSSEATQQTAIHTAVSGRLELLQATSSRLREYLDMVKSRNRTETQRIFKLLRQFELLVFLIELPEQAQQQATS